MRWVEIMEGRDAPLFHGTSGFKAATIITANRLEPYTIHRPAPHYGFLGPSDEVPEVEDYGVSGVSLSRSLRTALEFGEVVFQLDQAKLTQRHRVEPVDFWGHSNTTALLNARRQHKYAEAEEFVVGAIPNLSRYLQTIFITERAHQRYTTMRTGREDVSVIDALTDHPLLKIAR